MSGIQSVITPNWHPFPPHPAYCSRQLYSWDHLRCSRMGGWNNILLGRVGRRGWLGNHPSTVIGITSLLPQ